MNNEKRAYSSKLNMQDSDEPILQKIPFRITEISSEEEGYPVTELLNHTPFSRGWQSSRFCDFPQDIILEFSGTVRVRQIQFLSHQYKIASKIEISIMNSDNESNLKEFKARKFKKLGYLGLDSNERSNYQARELKSVYVDQYLQKIKISLHRCYINVHNTYSQVGLIAINILGEYTTKSGDKLNKNNFEKEVHVKLEEEMNFDPATLTRLKNLYKAKDKAVSMEDFDEAKKIKDAIERLKSVSQQLILLEERKRIAIKNDDFDSAKMLKYEVERLRNAVAGIQLTGPVDVDRVMPGYNNKTKVVAKKPIREEQEYQNEIDEIPMGKEKIRLMPVKQQGMKNEIPITSDMILEDEDTVMMTKHINPNQGYKLKDRDEIKKRIDVDEQVVKGMNKEFSEIVAEKMKKEGRGNKFDKEENEGDDDIPANEYKKAEPLIPVLTFDIVKKLFSKYWRNKEEAVKTLIDEIQNHPHSELFSQHQADKILTSVIGAAANVLACNVSQSLLATMDMLKILFNKFRGTSIQGYTRQDFDNYVDQCMLLLIEKVGDTNLKLKEKAENTVMEFANSTLVGHKTVFEDLITGQVKKTLVKSARHLTGRLNLISRMIDNFGLNSNDVPIDSLMEYTINAYKDPNKDVREAAFNLIMNIYRYVGDGIRKYFKELRPAQINLLEEGFENLDGLNNYGNDQDDEGGQQEFMNESKMIFERENNNTGKKDNRNDVNNKKSKKPNDNEYAKEEIRNSTPNNLNDKMNNEAGSCGFCGFFDPNFDEETLMLHCFKNCPMLAPCFKCKQVIEISSLNYHYLNECNFKKEFKQCARCKESYHLNEYNQHVAEKLCIPFKNPNVANRCPLCHTDNTPPGKVGWEVHLLQNTCPNNPRNNS